MRYLLKYFDKNASFEYFEKNSMYNVGVNKKIGDVWRCIWMGEGIDSEFLIKFWESAAFKANKKD